MGDKERIPDDTEKYPPDEAPNAPPPDAPDRPDPTDADGNPHTGWDHEGNPVYGDRHVGVGDEGHSSDNR